MAEPIVNRDSFRWQAEFCAKSGMTIITRVCEGVVAALEAAAARGSRTAARAWHWPGDPIADALPLRLVGGLHGTWRAGLAPLLDPVFSGRESDPAGIAEAVGAALLAYDDALYGWLDGPPQTNEPARSAIFMAGLLALAARTGTTRFELLEIGSSAGLNLMMDRYAFALGGVTAGPADAPIRIAPEWRGSPPPSAPVSIASIRGVDIAPIRVADPAAAERLMAYDWVDQQDRLARTERAIGMARVDPPRLEQGDAADWVEARLAEPPADGVFRVLMHSIVWQYLPAEGQARIEAAMAAAGARATVARPLGWIAYEGERALKTHGLTVRAWPGGGVPQRLASAHPHATWVEWGTA